ncbi:hypothetical protein ACFL34_01730 [Candidatus Sumerlaeota bacterium]
MTEKLQKQLDMFGGDETDEAADKMPSQVRPLPHLKDQTVDHLKKLLRILGLKTKLTRKADIVRFLSAFPQERPQDFLGVLSEAEKCFLAEAVYSGEGIAASVFTAKYDLDMPYMALDNYYGGHGDKRKKESSSLNLVMYLAEGTYTVCPHLNAIFKKALPKPPSLSLATTDALPEELEFSTWRGTARTPISLYKSESVTLTEARLVLHLAQSGKLKVSSKSRRPTAGTIRHVAKGLAEPDFELDDEEEKRDRWYDVAGPVRAHAWPVLLQQSGLLRAQNDVLKPTGTAKALLRSNDSKGWPDAVRRYIADDRFDELNRINHIRGQSGRGKRHLTPPSGRKNCIARALAELPIGEWVAFEEFFRYLIALREGFEVTRDDWSLYFAEQQYGALAYGTGDDLLKQYLRAVLMESLAVMGLIDIAYARPHGLWPEFSGLWGTDDIAFCGRYDGLSHIRLNRLGAWCLGLEKSWTPRVQTEKILVVQPNFEIVVPEAQKLRSAHRTVLDSIATSAGECVWRLEREPFLLAMENGRSGRDIIDYLEEHAQNALPDAVQISLESWLEKAESIAAVENTVLIRFSDFHDASLAAHDTQLKKIAQFVPPDSLVVSPKNTRAVRTALRKLGFVLPGEM